MRDWRKEFDDRFGFLNKIVENFGYDKKVLWGDEVKKFIEELLNTDNNTHKFMRLPDYGTNKNKEFRAEHIDAIAIWFEKDGMSHNAVLQQVVEKLAASGFASEYEIKEEWLSLLEDEIRDHPDD